ncbi:MAG TPA: nucleotidyltransferase family protein [Candidatus Limnocylindria bacterium]
MRPIAVVPAAGAAERFGSEKLLAPVGDVPMIERTIRSLLEGGAKRAVVVVAPGADELRRVLERIEHVSVEVNRARERGMLSSIQAGLRDAPGDPIVVLPGDMPYVEPATVAALLQRHSEEGAIVSPRFRGKRGHPVVIPGRLRDEILSATDDETLHDVLRRHSGERVDLDVADKGVVRDVDVPTDLEPAP